MLPDVYLIKNLNLSHFSETGYSNSDYKNWFFESQPTDAFQKTNFGCCRAVGAATPKIGLKMGISGTKAKKVRRAPHLLGFCLTI